MTSRSSYSISYWLFHSYSIFDRSIDVQSDSIFRFSDSIGQLSKSDSVLGFSDSYSGSPTRYSGFQIQYSVSLTRYSANYIRYILGFSAFSSPGLRTVNPQKTLHSLFYDSSFMNLATYTTFKQSLRTVILAPFCKVNFN